LDYNFSWQDGGSSGSKKRDIEDAYVSEKKIKKNGD
jgi:hypothetical protein